MADINVFAGAHFDRLGHCRRDREWLDRQWPGAVLAPVWNDRNLLSRDDSPLPVLLPVEAISGVTHGDCTLLGEIDDRVCFACDLGTGESGSEPLRDHGVFRSLRAAGALVRADHAALLACAQAMVHWHRRHQFCGSCGSASVAEEAGHVRRCSQCAQSIFPRIDPAVIVLVERDGRALLGRQQTWPAGIYSTIAGLVEPGESLEDAVRREVAEETGVRVTDVVYQSSQPWPFPSSLMLGFRARALNEEIELCDDELEDARWFSRDELTAGLRDGRYRLPTPLSISSRLLTAWFDGDTPGALAAVLGSLE